MRKQSNVQIHRNFLSTSQALRVRREFDGVYAEPRSTHPKRFLWDHWELSDQYRMHRTLAREFFSPQTYTALKNKLVHFGQQNLGCHSISEPWLSYYTEGDEQHLHTDSPHGPWAYVYSLTDWDARHFTGGETFILRPETLDYWPNYSRSRGREFHDLNLVVPPRFNQLLVFDPRLPHGVRRVSGTHDPRRARLVVHGWFVNPEPFVVGALNLNAVTRVLNRDLHPILSAAAGVCESTLDTLANCLAGMLVFRLHISTNGKVKKTEILTNTIIKTKPTEKIDHFLSAIKTELNRLNFPHARGQSKLTLPLIFD